MLFRGKMVPGRRPAPGAESDDQETEGSTPCRPRSRVYERHPGVDWDEHESPEPGALASVRRVLSDRKFHAAAELASVAGGEAECAAALSEMSSDGWTIERVGDRLRARLRARGDSARPIGLVLAGISWGRPAAEVSQEALEDEVQVVADEDEAAGDSPGGVGVLENEPADPADGLVVSDPPSDLVIGSDLVTGMTCLILSQRGAGKTYLAGVLVEELGGVPRYPQVVVVDPAGVFRGLASSSSGGSAEDDVLVVGGRRGSAPLAVGDGRRLSDLARRLSSAGKVPLVADLSLLGAAEQHEVCADLCTGIMEGDACPVIVVVDEVQEFCPQRLGALPEQQRRSRDAVERVAMRGRSRGVGLVATSLRPAVVSTNLRTQSESVFFLRMTEPHDLRAAGEWVDASHRSISASHRAECLSSLPVLPTGVAYYLRSGDHPAFRRIKVRAKRTWDSSRTPGAGISVEPVMRPPSPEVAEILSEVFSR